MKAEGLLRAMIVGLTLSAFALPGCGLLDGKKDDKAEKDDEDDEPKKKKKKKKKAEEEDDEPEKKADAPATSSPTAGGATAPGGTRADVAAPSTGTPPSQPAVPVTDPTLQTYPDLASKIPDGCKQAWVIMNTAPNSVGPDYPWTWTRQAMLANQQFRVVDGEPSAPGQVGFDLHLASDRYQNAWVLLARCADGTTCNKLAAMYKASVNGATAQPGCGALPMDLSPATFKKPVLRELGRSQNTLPEPSDTIGMCARLQTCSVAMDPPNKAGKEKIGFDCQKAPSRFKTDCARRYPCAEVMKCLEGK